LINRSIQHDPPLIGAHRGAHNNINYPENTLAAFKKAIDLNCDYIELDVHRTADGQLIVHHDFYVHHNKNEFNIERSSYSSLRQIPMLADQYIPTLKEVATLSHKKILLNVEVKADNIGIQVVEGLFEYGLSECDFWISSFNIQVLKDISKKFPSVKTGFLFLGRPWSASNKVFDKIINLGVQAIHPYYRFINNKVIQKAQKYSLEVHLWTVNGNNLKKYWKKSGITGIMTDDVEQALKIRKTLFK
jgi:glycerophosphoryl diester phosphodiesterase